MDLYKINKRFNWQTANNKIVKKYVADLYQSGTTPPVATELFNNTGIAFTYEYLAVGVYAVSCSKPIFSGCGMGCPTGQRTQVAISNNIYYSGLVLGYTIFPVADDYIILISSDGGTDTDDLIGHYSQNAIEITIYP